MQMSRRTLQETPAVAKQTTSNHHVCGFCRFTRLILWNAAMPAASSLFCKRQILFVSAANMTRRNSSHNFDLVDQVLRSLWQRLLMDKQFLPCSSKSLSCFLMMMVSQTNMMIDIPEFALHPQVRAETCFMPF